VHVQEVPDLAAEEIVTIDGDDSSQSSDISLNHPLQPFTTHTGQSRESEHSYVNYSYDDNDSNDVVSLIVDMLGESDSGSMSGVRVESDDSSDDQSVIISDSDSNQMVRTSSSDSIDSVDDRAEEPHTHASEQPPVMDSALSSAVSADVAATSSNTGLLGTDSRPQTLTSVDLDSSLECFRSKQTKNVLPGPSEDCRKDYSVLEAGEDGEVRPFRVCCACECFNRLY
jgi:hypothetical protein